ncbi:MAG: M1 family aminopeptidase, partial [Anaerolineae bacterium]
VGSDPVAEPWLDESLATYSVAVYLGDVFGPEAARSMIAYFRRESGGTGGGSTGIAVSALDFSTWSDYRAPVYHRGALFLDSLRSEMGDDAFYAFLSDYARTYRFGIATAADLTALADKHAGRPLDSVYQMWFGVPEPGIQS